MSRASSLTPSSLSAGLPRPWSHSRPNRAKGVNFSLAAALVEGVGAAAKIKSQWDRPHAEIAPHRIEQVAAIAFRQFLEPVREPYDARRPRLHLRDVAELDPLAPGRRRRVRVDRAFEPAVEL